MLPKFEAIYYHLLNQQKELITEAKKRIISILESKGELLPFPKLEKHILHLSNGYIIIYSNWPEFCIGKIEIKTPSKGEFLEYSSGYVPSEDNIDRLIKVADILIKEYGR